MVVEASPSAPVGKTVSSSVPSTQRVGDVPRRVRGPRRVTLRVLFFFVVLGAVAYGAWALIRWYVDGSYYVGLQKTQVVIYQGRPGGFVGMEPKVIKRSGVTTAEINSDVLAMLRTGVQEPSRQAAESYVSQLDHSLCDLPSPPAGVDCSTPTTPTTTVVAHHDADATAPTPTASRVAPPRCVVAPRSPWLCRPARCAPVPLVAPATRPTAPRRQRRCGYCRGVE